MKLSRKKWLAAVLLLTGFASAEDVVPVRHEANAPNSKRAQKAHYVVMVSLDGFRYDYARKWGATHLEQMAEEGASAPEGMIPSFPSLTFPNHYTIATGLYPEHHGIVDNEFLDPKRNYEKYLFSSPVANGDGSWFGGVPLWSLAEQQGMRSASIFWIGSQAKIAGKRPSYWVPFDDHLDDEKRVAQVMDWLALPEVERPHLIAIYFSNVDHAGHDYGPDSLQCRDAVLHVDALMGELREKLKASGLSVDLIVVSDHGMVNYRDQRWLFVEKLVDLKDARVTGERIYAKSEAETQRIYDELKAKNDPRIALYRRKDVPARLMFNGNEREGDPIVVPVGLQPVTVGEKASMYKSIGGHGFDPSQVPEMKAIFYAAGPDVKPGVKLESFSNVNVYDFVAGILKLKPAKNDGDAKLLKVARR